MLKVQIKKYLNLKKIIKVKQIVIKRISTKFNIKIKWNQMLSDEIEK
jgi:hypothetical protein